MIFCSFGVSTVVGQIKHNDFIRIQHKLDTDSHSNIDYERSPADDGTAGSVDGTHIELFISYIYFFQLPYTDQYTVMPPYMDQNTVEI